MSKSISNTVSSSSIISPLTSQLPVSGRVIRLHFVCRAELPHGSMLRVTGASSSLWTTSSVTPLLDDLPSKDHLPGSYSSLPFTSYVIRTNGRTEGGCENFDLNDNSVEMITSPDMYPIWRTRTPVVIVINHFNFGRKEYEVNSDNIFISEHIFNDRINIDSGKDTCVKHLELEGVFRHKYRYMVSVPYAEEKNVEEIDALDKKNPIMNWEDPFIGGLDEGVSLRSIIDLPYRTIDIDVSSINSPTFGSVIMRCGTKKEDNYDNICIDRWNDRTDPSFNYYVTYLRGRRLYTHHSTSSTRSILNSKGKFSSVNVVENDILSNNGKESAYALTDKQKQESCKLSKRRIFLLCYHLPVIIKRITSYSSNCLISKGWSACWSESLLAKTEQFGVSTSYDTNWIGTVSAEPPITTEEERNEIRKVLQPMNCTPIFLTKEFTDTFYYGMCKQVLWPVFHNIDLLDICMSGWGQGGNMICNKSHQRDLDIDIDKSKENVLGNGSRTESNWDQSRLDRWWEAYVRVNKIFSDIVASVIKPFDILWVHDYHLSLLPKHLDASGILTIGNNDGLISDNAAFRNIVTINQTKELSCESVVSPLTQKGRGRTIQMVFFLHIPFPTSQVFRELKHGEAILEGMLHADVVGFHAFDHARHFLNASKRLLGLSYESLLGGLIGVRYRGTKVLVTISNVSIESNVVESVMRLPSVDERYGQLKQKHSDKIIIAGVDIAQRLSGVSLKLLAYESFLNDYQNIWRTKVVLVQRCLVPGSRKTDEANTLLHVHYLVQRIQKVFGPNVIDYEEIYGSSLPMDERLAIWYASDVFMSTSIREGLNLLPLEYVFVRKAPLQAGVTITSEFSAVSSILNGALRVNPFDIRATSSSIDKALTMSTKEKNGRRERDIDFISNSPSGMWTRNVLCDLNDVILGIKEEHSSIVKRRVSRDETRLKGRGPVATKLAVDIDMAIAPLNFSAVNAAYTRASNRVLLIDFNGTVVMKEPPGKYLKREMLGAPGNKPLSEVINALNKLCSDEKNTVYVVSGDTKTNIEDAVGSISGLGLASGNGGSMSQPLNILKRGKKNQMETIERIWRTSDLGVDWEAVKRISLPILSKYTARTNGSFVKLTDSSIGWSYYSCDPEWGSMQASYLVMELRRELNTFDVRFVTLKGVVEVVPRKLNKGLVVKNVLDNVHKFNDPIDFILCIGDDISDEKMFTSIFDFVAKLGNERCNDTTNLDVLKTPSAIIKCDLLPEKRRDIRKTNLYVYTVTVGKKSSHASYYVQNASDVANILINLSGLSVPKHLYWDNSKFHSEIFD